ncbi:hypothetical protein LSH36_561g03082 [Paralvinella palmiformis]|uniref:Uncharacterized protein n=1 Tax=Paralvinella palmiformis TaxID=53620 RepID=A0AAD9J6E1_9ANNE|nr:hypothetical protein LSH36_561g03082 [Paralvinella palmiformis]
MQWENDCSLFIQSCQQSLFSSLARLLPKSSTSWQNT